MLSVDFQINQISPNEIQVVDLTNYTGFTRADVELTVKIFMVVGGLPQPPILLLYDPFSWTTINTTLPDGIYRVEVCAKWTGLKSFATSPIPITNIKIPLAIWVDEIGGTSAWTGPFGYSSVQAFVDSVNAVNPDGVFYAEIQGDYVVFGFTDVEGTYNSLDYESGSFPGGTINVPFELLDAGFLDDCTTKVHVQQSEINKCLDRYICQTLNTQDCVSVSDIEAANKVRIIRSILTYENVISNEGNFNALVGYGLLYCKECC